MNPYEDTFNNPLKYPIYPIHCRGYCITPVYSYSCNADEIPTIVEMKSTTSDVAEKEGWTTTRNKKFSMNGEIVWLCPECTKDWNQERQQKIDYIINSKKKLHKKYINETSDEQRAMIIDEILFYLRSEFIDLEPKNEDWKKWNIA